MFLREYWREKIWKYFRVVLTRSLVGCLRREHMKYWMSKVSFNPWNQMKNHFRFYWEDSKLPHRIKEMTKTCVGGDGLGGYRGNQGRLKRDCQRCQGWVSPCAYARTLRYCSGWSGPCQTSGWYCRKWTMLSLFLAASPPWYQPSLPTQTKKKYFDIVSFLRIFVILPSTLTILTLIVSVVE